MTADRISMREASSVLGVSQLRVRELIRRGKLEAERVSEDGVDRWAIHTSSVEAFRARRSDNGEATMSDPVKSLKTLVSQLEAAQRQINSLVRSARDVAAAIEGRTPPSAQPKPKPKPKPKPNAKAEPGVSSKPKPKPKAGPAQAKESKARTDAEAPDTVMATALREAGVTGEPSGDQTPS